MKNFIYAILFLSGFIGTYLIIPFFENMLIKSNVIRPNYKKENIPVSMGIVFLPMLLINAILLVVLTNDNTLMNSQNLLYLSIFLFALMAIFFAGILDDIVGNRDVSGLGGHLKSLLKGDLTTGGFKALFGGFVGVFVSVIISDNILSFIINTLIIALSTNLMNLLDLRPGRAIKGFLTIMIIMFFFLVGYVKYFPFLIVPNVLAYFNRDLKAKAMMGDTGSNVLGIAIGVIMVLGFSSSLTISGSWLLFLIAIHLLTERYSLTNIIENNKVLNYIDKLGR
jgi:UDP-N-acetylmuramyl pentapeptide phosphotransferase/UDP-N-acetylglucosamine-1-phosphate transferase